MSQAIDPRVDIGHVHLKVAAPEGEEAEEEVAREEARSGASGDGTWAPLAVHSC